MNNVSNFFSFPFRYKQEKDCSWTDTSTVLRHCSHPPHHLLLWLVASSSCQHGKYVPPLAVPLTSTLDHHHGEKTQKEINLAAQAVCSMDSFLELWTWNAVSSPLTLNQVLAAHFSSVSARLMLELYWSASNRYLVLRYNSKMLLLPVWASMLLGLLVGFLPLVGMEPTGGAKSGSDHATNSEPLPSSSGSNCSSQLTLKLEFSSKVVEHGKTSVEDDFGCVSVSCI